MKKRLIALAPLLVFQCVLALLFLAFVLANDAAFGILFAAGGLSVTAGLLAGKTKKRWKDWEYAMPVVPFVPVTILFASLGANPPALLLTMFVGTLAVPGIMLGNYLHKREQAVLAAAAKRYETGTTTPPPHISEYAARLKRTGDIDRLGPIAQIPLE